MKVYKNHTKPALEAEIQNVKNLLRLVNEMKKPDNFTYIDILNLHTHLEELLDCLKQELKERESA